MLNPLISCIVIVFLVLNPCSAAGGGGNPVKPSTPVKDYEETVEKLFEKTFDLFNKTLTFYPSAYPVKSFVVVYPGNEKFVNFKGLFINDVTLLRESEV